MISSGYSTKNSRNNSHRYTFFSKSDKYLILVAFGIYLIHICSAIVTKRYYYADGAFTFANLLNSKNSAYPISNDASVCRIGINFLNQFLVVLFMKLGIKNISLLSAAFGAPLFIINLIGIFLCWRKCRDRSDSHRLMIFPLAAYVFFCIPSDIFSVNQAFSAFWVYLVLFFHIIFDNSSLSDWFITAILLILAPFSHESYLIVGPVLLIILAMEFFFGHKKRGIEWIFVEIYLLMGFFYQLWYKCTHVALTTGDYFGSILNLLKIENLLRSNFIISGIGLVVVILIFINPIRRKSFWILLSILGVSYILFVHSIEKQYNPFLEHGERGLVTIGAAGGIVLTYLFYYFGDEKLLIVEDVFRYWWRVTILVLSLQCIWQIGNTMEWNKYFREFEQAVNTEQGVIPPYKQDNPFAWSWTQPSMSLLCAKSDYRITCIMDCPMEEKQTTISENDIWIPFCTVNESVFDLSELRSYEQKTKFSIDECKNINIENIDNELKFDKENHSVTRIRITNNSNMILQDSEFFASYHVYTQNGCCVLWDGIRTELGHSIQPGESILVDVGIDLFDVLTSEDYYVVIDLVKEYDFWFIDNGMEEIRLGITFPSTDM